MNLSSEIIDGAHIVRVNEDRIDASVAIQFKDRMREIAGNSVGRVVLNLEQVAFVDSSGLGSIVAVMKFLAPACKLELAALSPVVGKVFHMTRMDSVFAIHDKAPSQRP